MNTGKVAAYGILMVLVLLLTVHVGMGQAEAPSVLASSRRALSGEGPQLWAGEPTSADWPRGRGPGAGAQAGSGIGPLSGRLPISPVSSSPGATGAGEPAVAYNHRLMGAYLVAWQQMTADYGASVVYTRLVNKNGTPNGLVGAVSSDVGYNQYPAVAYNSVLDQFLVVWQVSGQRIDGRVLNNTGSPAGPVRPIVWCDTGICERPSLVYSPAANQYLLVWQYAEGSTLSIDAVGVDADGTVPPADLPLCVSGRQDVVTPLEPAVAYNGAMDQALVVWQQWAGAGDTTQHDIRGRLISMAGGAHLAGPRVAIFNSTDDEVAPSVAALSTPAGTGGRYLVAAERYYGGTPMVDGHRLNGSDLSFDAWIPISPLGGREPAVAASEVSGQFLGASTLDVSSLQASTVPGDGFGGTYGVLYGVNPTRPVVAAGFGGDFLVAFSDSFETGDVYGIFGWLWGDRIFLPSIQRHG